MKLRNKKTGEIIDLDIANIKAQYGGISIIPLPIKLGGDEYVYYTLKGLVDEWEDYQPKEPLIKDEKIRKAVRAWADACGTKTVEITHSRPHMLRIMDATDDDEICFNREIGQVFDEIIYNTIAELCGEEEE